MFLRRFTNTLDSLDLIKFDSLDTAVVVEDSQKCNSKEVSNVGLHYVSSNSKLCVEKFEMVIFNKWLMWQRLRSVILYQYRTFPLSPK